MKISVSYIFIILFFSKLYAQGTEVDVVSRHRPGFMWYFTGIKPAIPEKVRKYDRLVFDIVYNDWQSKEVKPFKVLPTSIGFNTNLLFDVPLAKNNVVSLGIGVAYGLFRISMNDYFVRNDVNNSTILKNDIKQFGIDKSVFKMNSISVPLEIRFRGKNWKHAKLHLGGKISYQFHASTSLATKFNGINSQQKTIGFYDLNPLNISSHIRFGFRNWSVYSSYSFMPIFKNNLSTKLNPLQLGISISLF